MVISLKKYYNRYSLILPLFPIYKSTVPSQQKHFHRNCSKQNRNASLENYTTIANYVLKINHHLYFLFQTVFKWPIHKINLHRAKREISVIIEFHKSSFSASCIVITNYHNQKLSNHWVDRHAYRSDFRSITSAPSMSTRNTATENQRVKRKFYWPK